LKRWGCLKTHIKRLSLIPSAQLSPSIVFMPIGLTADADLKIYFRPMDRLDVLLRGGNDDTYNALIELRKFG
jgi:hypothetical protein